MTDITWGDPIEVNGVRPAWLGDEDKVQWESETAPFAFLWHDDADYWLASTVCQWEFKTAIRLPADHPYYSARPETSGYAEAGEDGDLTPLARAARAIYCAEQNINYDQNVAHVEYWFDKARCDADGEECVADEYLGFARAAIAAIREPSCEVLEEGVFTDIFQGFHDDAEARRDILRAWQVMIDKVLS